MGLPSHLTYLLTTCQKATVRTGHGTTDWFKVGKGFSVGSETEVDVFLESFCFLFLPTSVGNLISGSSIFSKSSLYIWKFLVHILLTPSLKDFEHYIASMLNECICILMPNL